MNDKPIETSAVVVREESRALERLPLDEVHAQLEFIRQVMAREMKEGQDYGKIPGCGDKPGLFQPGAQKLLLTFQLTPHVKKEVLRELPHPTIFGHREYEFTLTLKSKAGREWDGVGTCSTLESKYRYRSASLKCPDCGKTTIFKSKKPGEGWYCWAKKGGCSAQFKPDAPGITNQDVGKVDNENPAEFWNTVRKMAFKRALVHGAINATNTSALWSQDLEDLPQATSARSEYIPEPEESFESASGNAQTPPQRTETSKSSQSSTAPSKTPSSPVSATPKHRLKALDNLQAAPGQPNEVLMQDYLRLKKWISGKQGNLDWPLVNVPATPAEMSALSEDVIRFEVEQKEKEGRSVAT